MEEAEYFVTAVSDADKVQVLVEFVAWCHRKVTKPVQLGNFFGRATLPPRQLTNGVAHVVAAY